MASRGKPRGEGGGGEGWDDPWDQLGAGSSWQDSWPELPGEVPPPLAPATAMPGQGLPIAESAPTVNAEPLGPPLFREPLERSPAQAPAQGQAAQKSGESAEPTAPPPPRYAPTALRSVFVSSSWPRAAVAAPSVAAQPVAAALGSASPAPPPVEPVPPEAPPAPELPVEVEDDSRLLKPRFRKGSLRGAFQRE